MVPRALEDLVTPLRGLHLKDEEAVLFKAIIILNSRKSELCGENLLIHWNQSVSLVYLSTFISIYSSLSFSLSIFLSPVFFFFSYSTFLRCLAPLTFFLFSSSLFLISYFSLTFSPFPLSLCLNNNFCRFLSLILWSLSCRSLRPLPWRSRKHRVPAWQVPGDTVPCSPRDSPQGSRFITVRQYSTPHALRHSKYYSFQFIPSRRLL